MNLNLEKQEEEFEEKVGFRGTWPMWAWPLVCAAVYVTIGYLVFG